jgi:hypothetical protein
MSSNQQLAQRCRILLACGTLILFCLPVHGRSQGKPIEIRVDDPRPLANAVQALEERFGWVITYEDPPFVHTSDLIDRADPEAKRADAGLPAVAPRDLVPRGGAFTFTYELPDGQEPAPERVLMSLLSQFHSRNLGSEFRLFHTGSVFHIVPAKSKDSAGEPVVRRSVLSTRISVKAERRTVTDMIREILREVSKSTSIPMIVATIPMNRFRQVEVQGGATDEPAQDVLLRTLESAGTYSWLLFYANDLVPPTYALNIIAVQHPTRQPAHPARAASSR